MAKPITSHQLNQFPLPKQPLPDLDDSVKSYLKSLQPILTEIEHKNAEKAVVEFVQEGGAARELYRKLQEKHAKKDNWLSDWWMEEHYLCFRDFILTKYNSSTVGPKQNFECLDDYCRYAAHLIGGVLDYNDMIKGGKLKQEFVRGTPLDMQQYGTFLGSHRRPGDGMDELFHTDDSNHVILISNNHFFKVQLSERVDEEQLVGTVKDVVERSRVPGKPVGILTGNSRDAWYEDYSKLEILGTNGKIIKELETSLFILCLDRELPKECFVDRNPKSMLALQSLTGYSSSTNGGNRWHDKTVQLILSNDGLVGMEYEHVPCEGHAVARLFDHALNYVENKLKSDIKVPKHFPTAEHLQFEVNEPLELSIKNVAMTIDNITQDLDMECIIFDEFGMEEVKKYKLSPDSFFQMALQLTYYKLCQKMPIHYETVSMRRFQNARTECVRSTSNESMRFVKSMAKKDATRSEAKIAMVAAINVHKELVNKAVTGGGFDRMFYGLRMIARDEKMELPKFFTDPGYTKSISFTLTSSQVAFKTESFMCFSPAVLDGYACCYNLRPNDMILAISSFTKCSETSSRRFAETMKESLRDMRELALR